GVKPTGPHLTVATGARFLQAVARRWAMQVDDAATGTQSSQLLVSPPLSPAQKGRRRVGRAELRRRTRVAAPPPSSLVMSERRRDALDAPWHPPLPRPTVRPRAPPTPRPERSWYSAQAS